MLAANFIFAGTIFADDFNEGIPAIEVVNGNITYKVPYINATAAIVLDVKSGRVLYEKNARIKKSIASTTKIMTAIIAIENGNLEDEVIISKRAANVSGSSIDLRQGEKIKLGDLLYGLMLNSGNDAAVAIAEHIGGSVENFAFMMNKKAEVLGALDTNYRSPHGLDLPDQYCTAYDLALITKYALSNKIFSKIVATKSINIANRNLYNTNEMLSIYPGADGVKTGYTGQAGRCLVTSVTKNNWKLISIVLNCPTRNIRAQSSKDILDYAYLNYKPYKITNANDNIKKLPVIKGIKKEVQISVVDEIELPLRKEEIQDMQKHIELPESLEAPVYEGVEIGSIKYYVSGKLIAESALKVESNIPRKGFKDYLWDIVISWGELMHR
jgi:serine-type D-Ala-D-Ala carboxypeptidase (penicillin-binding protein 5/6)